MVKSCACGWASLALAASLAWPSGLGAQFSAPPAPAAYALQGVTVVFADGRSRAGVNVVVRGGLIEAIGPDVELPPDARLLEGDSLYVYPGIVDAQGGAEYEFPEVEVDRSEVASWNPPRDVQGFMPQRRVVDYLAVTGADLADQRRKGVVAGAVIPSGRLVPGRGAVLIYRPGAETPDALVAEPVLGPTMSLQGARGVYPSTLFAVIAFYRQMFEDARHNAAHIQAFDRHRKGVAPPQWDPDLDVVRQVMGGTTPVFFEADLGRDIRRVLELADEYGFKPLIVGGDEAWQVADELKAARVPVLISLDFPKPARWKPDEKEKKAEEAEPGDGGSQDEEQEELDAGALREKRRIEAIYENASRLAEAGVSFALTSGGGKADLLEGARKAIEYGLSEEDALRALTITPASLLGIDHVTRIEVGMPATFIVSDGPLFDEETSVRYTFVEGALELGKKGAGSGEAPTVDVTGTWDLTMETEMGTFESTLTLTQEGADLRGSTRSEFAQGRVVSGTVSGNSIEFTVSFSMGDQSFDIEFSGTVEGDTASGSGEGGMVGSFEWTAKRAGPAGEEIEG